MFAALPESQSFLATVVGINNAVLANEIPGMQTLNLDDANKVKEAATNVRRKTVPREVQCFILKTSWVLFASVVLQINNLAHSLVTSRT